MQWLVARNHPAEGWRQLTQNVTHTVLFHAGAQRYLKQFKQTAQYRRERDALHALRTQLKGVPQVVDLEDSLCVMVTEACPGVPTTKDLLVDSAVWVAAGAWLAGLHGLPCVAPLTPADPMPLQVAIELRRQRLLLEVRRLSQLAAAARFTTALQTCVWLGGEMNRVPCHRDFEPRNWLWSAAERSFCVIDFEHLRADAPAFDMVKVLEACGSSQSQGWTSFVNGYRAGGGCLPDAECVRAAFVHHAALTWVWGERHGDRGWSLRGLAMLDRL